MVQMPLFSILLPTHNRPDVIAHSIRSVLDQTCDDFELLVAGDGATAETAAEVLAFNDPRIRWFDLPKAVGFGYSNRNAVLRQARGKFFAFAADDDLILPNHLSELRRLLDTGAALVCTRAAWVSTDGVAAPFLTNLDIADEREIFLTYQNSIPSSCFAYRSDALPDKGAWPEAEPAGGDWRLWQRIIASNPVRPLACSTAITVLHFSALSKNARDSRMMELRRLLEFSDRSCWWPEELKVRIMQGSTEQAAWADRVRRGGHTFLEEFNSAIRLVVDRLAWEYVQLAVPIHVRKLSILEREAFLPEDFNPQVYLSLHPDVAAAGADPVSHWLVHGYFEGRAYKDTLPKRK